MKKKELEKLFDELNAKWFFGNLPKPKIKTYATKQKYLGKIIAKIDLRTLKFKDYRIYISVRYANWTREDYIGVLLHEMIHLYEYAYRSRCFFTKDNEGSIYKYKYNKHGTFFCDLASDIEKMSGHHIFITDHPNDTKTLTERAIRIKNKHLND